MPTENPKISAYVPQLLYDSLKRYQEETGLSSMSQVATVLLAQALGVEIESPGDVAKIGGVTSEQFEALAKEVEDLRIKLSQVLDKVDSLQSTGEPLIEEEVVEKVEIEDTQEKLGENREEDSSSQVGNGEPQLNLLSELLSEIPPISGKDLALRLGISDSKLSTTKNEKSPDDFSQWTGKNDPDNITWSYRPKSKGKGVVYFPSNENELPSELKSELLRWVKDKSS